MALNTHLLQSVDSSSVRIAEPNRSTGQADLVFEGGLLKLAHYGLAWRALSGPHGNGALPRGTYLCRNFRTRTKASMVRNGVGFSVDLEPTFSTHRTLLRIHPDGNVPGTLGCIGVTDPDVAGCRDALARLLPGRQSVAHLVVR